jgi:hypothetical protein
MGEQTIKVLENAKARVLIVKRADGTYAYRTQARFLDGWHAPGPDLDVYDTPETAESEARARVWWLANSG